VVSTRLDPSRTAGGHELRLLEDGIGFRQRGWRLNSLAI
jgi:hypothetical protein